MECIPQNDLDCYYNNKWISKNSYLYKKNISLNNFTITQHRIDEFFYNFIDKSEFSDSVIHNNMILFRNSYLTRSDKSCITHIEQLINTVIGIRMLDDLSQCVKLLNSIGIYTFFTFNVVSNYKFPDVYVIGIGDPILTLEYED